MEEALCDPRRSSTGKGVDQFRRDVLVHGVKEQFFKYEPGGLNVRRWKDAIPRNRGEEIISTVEVS